MKYKIKTFYLKLIPYLFIAICLLSLNENIQAQPGTLDNSFGDSGKVISANGGFIYASALQKDGKIIIAGNGGEPYSDFLLMRYNTDGSIDSSFGNNGQVITVTAESVFLLEARDVIVQDDGKIIVAGYGYRKVYNPNYLEDLDAVLIRYNSNGTVDSSFGKNGIADSDFGDDDEEAYAVALQPDGRIVICGGSDQSWLVARYMPNGSLDASFSGDGWIRTVYKGFDLALSIAVQPDGKILAAGQTGIGSERTVFILARYLPDGNADASFGSNGTVMTDFATGGDRIRSIVLQPDGKIVAAGVAGDKPGFEGVIALLRYQYNGRPDSSFGEGGKVITRLKTGYSRAEKALLQPDGRIVIAATSFDYLADSIFSDFAVLRYNTNGSLDESFGKNGIQITDFGKSADAAFDAILQPDGKIVVVGFIDAVYNAALARYNGDNLSILSFEKNITRQEGNSGYTTATFNLVLNKPSATDITVTIATKNGAAKAGSDYIADSSTVTIKAGRVKKNVRIKIVGDTEPERNEKFHLILSNPVNAILGELDTASCTIKNDDAAFATNNVSEANLAIPDAAIKIYPNPAKNNLTIEGLPTNGATELFVTDLYGNNLLKAKVNGIACNLNIAPLKAGTYIIRIQTGNETITRKFVKQ